MKLVYCCLLFFIFYQVESSTGSPDECKDNEFRCKDGKCIDKTKRCDGINDCAQGSDEVDCVANNSVGLGAKNDMTKSDKRPISKARKLHKKAELYSVKNLLQDEPANVEQTAFGDPEYFDLSTYEYEDVKKRALEWLILQRNEDFSWGHETHRALTALYISKHLEFHPEVDDKLMFKQLHLELALAIARNGSKEMSLSDLSIYINALQVTCSNPRNFHGFDLVDILRQRTNVAQNSKQVVLPFVYLTLCLNDVTSSNDSRKLSEMFRTNELPTSVINRIDLQAVALLASVCILKLPGSTASSYSYNVHKATLSYSMQKDSLPRNVYEAALLVQAFNEARINPSVWNRTGMMDFILKQQNVSGSFGDILATYYVLPILSGRSLLSVNEICGQSNFGDFNPLEVVKNKPKRQIIKYYLYYGYPVEIMQSLQLQTAADTSFFDIMRLAEEINPVFKFRLDNNTLSEVYSIGGIPNDAEKGIFWELYTDKKDHNGYTTGILEPIPYKNSIKNLIPKNGDKLIFWLRPLKK